jgi:hypothetical protein
VFNRVPEQKSYVISVVGPGTLTVRLHRIFPIGTAANVPSSTYSIVVLEDDSVLQSLEGKHAPSAAWTDDDTRLAVSEPHEYRLTVGNKTANIAFQIADARDGMLIRHDFQQEKVSLAALGLSLDDTGEGAHVQPTVVMEVDVRTQVTEREGIVGAAVSGMVALSPTGGGPAPLAFVELRLPVPFVPRRYAVTGLQLGAEQHIINIRVADVEGAILEARTTTQAVPVFAKATGRLPLGDSLALFASAAGGLVYLRSERQAQGATTRNTQWLVGGRGALGAELDIGWGWIGIEAGYLYTPAADVEGTLRDYSPGGVSAGVQYRVGI